MRGRPAAVVALLLAFLAAGCASPRAPPPAAGAHRRSVRAPPSSPPSSSLSSRPAPPHGPAPRTAPTGPRVDSRPLDPLAQPAPREAPAPAPARLSRLQDLPGWEEDDHAAAFAAFATGCGVARDPDLRAACAAARAAGPLDEAEARRFFEARFRAAPAPGEGVLTAYFAPEYEARTRPDGAFTAPVRPRPPSAAGGTGYAYAAVDDPTALLDGPPPPVAAGGPSLLYAGRGEIERAPAPDALAWMRPEDLFFLQIQGSGTLVFETGRRAKANYAGDNGRPFTPIARPMAELGLLPRNRTGGDDIRRWLSDHAGPEADAVMQRNARYIFFALTGDDGRDPLGASGVSLPPGRSLAVDPSRHLYGEPWWIDADAPVLSGAAKRYRRLAMALDTGSAIRGEVRADLYTGRGDAAGREAGRVRHTLRMTRLVPLPSAATAR